jgi:ATP-binding cassette subfamily B protein
VTGTSGLEGYLDVEERESRRIDTGNLRRLAGHILRHRASLAGGLLMVVTGTAAALAEPRLFGFAIDDAIVPGNWPRLRELAIIYLGVICVRGVAAVFQGYLFELLGQRVTQDLRVALYTRLQRLPVAVFDKNPAGRLLTRVTNDVAALAEMFSAGFLSILSNALLVLGIIVWLFVLDFRLGLITAAVLPPLAAASVYFSGKLRIAYRDARSKLSALNAFLAENLLGMRVVHLFNREKLHLERFDRVNQWYADAQIGSVKVFALFQPAITVSSGIAMSLVIWYGGSGALHGSIKPGVLVAFFSYVLSLFQPLRELADKWNIFLSGMASAERIFSILDWEAEPDSERATLPAVPLEGVKGHIVFENVWFAYSGEHWVLRDFSLELKPGARVGIVGHTGAGKTTLISLLMRFYDPQRGRILLDGKDLRDYDKRRLRATIGIVQQDVFLFSGGFADNVDFFGSTERDGARAAESARVRSALVRLGADRWLEGRESFGERGGGLSMGQRQLLAFARALAHEPAVWILDEATANMDSETERRLQGALDAASSGRTRLLIAHRLATVRDADVIAVLRRGALVERGRHDELLALDGLYARLYRFQQATAGLG